MQSDLDDQTNELRVAEEHAKKAMADAARLAEELRQEQEHAGHIGALQATERGLQDTSTFHSVWALCGLSSVGKAKQ